MGQISLSIPQVGAANSTEDPKVANDFTTLQTVINGNLDATNLSATLAQSAAVNQAGQTVKGASAIASSETRTNTAYGTMPTADQVTGIVLPTSGLIAVWFQATWQESISGAGRAAIFIGSNQLKVGDGQTNPFTQAAATNNGSATNNQQLTSFVSGLVSSSSAVYAGDVTTGQATGIAGRGANQIAEELGGTVATIGGGGVNIAAPVGGPCYIDNLPAGTYTISVQFKASSGSVTASNRRLRALALAFG